MSDSIIIFDGVCNLCHWSVRLIMRHDRKQQFRFVTLQSPEAKELLNSAGFHQPDLGSVVYLENGQAFLKSEAFFRIAKKMDGFYNMLLIFRLLPTRIADKIYRLIAMNRNKWFGKMDQCSLPKSEEGEHRLNNLPIDRTIP